MGPNFKCRVHEEENKVIFTDDPEGYNRSGKKLMTRSSACKKEDPDDMIQMTLRCK